MKQPLWCVYRVCGHQSIAPSSFLQENQSHSKRTQRVWSCSLPQLRGRDRLCPPQLLPIIWMPAPTAQTCSSLSITSASHILSGCLCSVIANVPAPWVALLVLGDMLSCSHGPQLFLEQALHLFNVMVSARGQRTCVVLRVTILSCSFLGQRHQRQNQIHAAGSRLDAKSRNNCHWVREQLTEIK